MDQPLISVIIPVYNMELYLERCLDSVLNNTYRNLEVICVDDGSKDSSLEILRRYEAADPRIVVIAKENGGVSSARNAGLDRMTGAYVAFVDPDDYVHPQYFDLLYRTLEKGGTRISICGFQTVDANTAGMTEESYSQDSIPVQVFSFLQVFKSRNLRSYCWGKLISSELVNAIHFHEDLKLAEDTAFFAEVCEKESAGIVAVISCPLYYYYQREASAVKLAKAPQFLQFGRIWTQRLIQTNRDDIYLDKAIEWHLSIRYLCSYILPDKTTARECNTQLMNLRLRLLKTHIYGMTTRLIYLVFILFPRLYWLHRVVGDPSMLQWEKMERKKRRAEKRNERSSR